MRYDLHIIASWITPKSRVLDLGCGAGELLAHLKEEKQIKGNGIDNDEENVAKCIEQGVSALQGDIISEVVDYPDHAFDFVILSQTLQQVYEPHKLIKELLRIGKHIIVSFPNFSHWPIRMQLAFRGYAPKNQQLPFDWYDTPNIRVITIHDFQRFIKKTGCQIDKEIAINTNSDDFHGKIITVLPNLRASFGIFMVSQKQGQLQE